MRRYGERVKELLSGRSAPGREQAWFALGALLILIHTVDDTIALGEVDVAPAVIEAIAVVAALLYRLLPWFVALLAALVVGITRLVGGVGHLLSLADPAPGDSTGIFEALRALCILAVAVGIVRRQVDARRTTSTQPV